MRKIILLCIWSLMTLNGFAQRKLKLYFIQDLDIKGQENFIKDNNLSTYQIVYENFFVTNDKVDEAKLKRQLANKFPDVDDDGICVLDWEGNAIKEFQKNNNKQKVDYYKSEFKKAIKVAKAFRPKVKFAFFHLMYLGYYGKVSDYRKQNANLEDLIKMQDFIAPSLYVYNPTEKYQKSNDNYMQGKLLQALEIGYKYNIPTYPFIWHRTVSRTKGAGNDLISTKYFSGVVKLISQTSYSGVSANGILWWHSESYSYRNKARFSIANNEYKSISDVNRYQQDLFQKYLSSIRAYIN